MIASLSIKANFRKLLLFLCCIQSRTFGFSATSLRSSTSSIDRIVLPTSVALQGSNNINAATRVSQLHLQNGPSMESPLTIPESSANGVNEQNSTVSFPPLSELQSVRRGDYIASPSFKVQCQTQDQEKQEHEFRVLLYPRGGGHSSSYTAMGKTTKNASNNNNKKEGGFGMGYQIVPLFQKDDAVNDRVGVYLQYLPKNNDDTVDATFSLRLKGQQSSGPRFDVDWTTGMRFVAPEQGSLREGTANDFGAHMVQSYLLESFLGGEETNANLDVEVKVKIHPTKESSSESVDSQGGFPSIADIRKTDEPGMHDADNVRVGKIVVPILRKLSQRPRMFKLGAYPGVEYRIIRILHPETGKDIFTSMPGADYELKPIYPLVPALERSWPVRVNESELPKLYTMNMYNAISAIGSLLTAATGLVTAFIISQLISFFFIPSKSMDPTLQVGDVLLVEKVTPRLLKNPNVGDVVLFNPNSKLQDIVKSSGGRISDRDLFVKRVAAVPGDYVSVDATGKVSVNGVPTNGKRDLCEEEPLRLIQRFVQPVENQEIKADEIFVMGDCSSVSVDSRVWGPLTKDDLVGKPILRAWPLGRWGTVPPLPTLDTQISETTSLVSEWNN